MKKILLYGGAFNPPHLGHEHLLESAINEINPDLTLIVPTAVSPHKNTAETSFSDRAYMSRTFLGCGGKVKISGMEAQGGRRKSYTINTVSRIKKKYKDPEIYLLIGSDMLISFNKWHRYRRLCAMVTIIAASRQGRDGTHMLEAKRNLEKLGVNVILLDIAPLEISSTEIRARLRDKKDVSDMVSEHVARYALERELYK